MTKIIGFGRCLGKTTMAILESHATGHYIVCANRRMADNTFRFAKQLGYTIPNKIVKKAGLSKVRIFAEGSNIFTLSGLPKGIDPESPGVNNGYYPQQKTFMGGITVSF